MKVILLEDVKKVGKRDTIVDVSDGYATNYLIKNKLAVQYTKRSKELLDVKLDKFKEEENKRLSEYNEIRKKLENKIIDFKVKTGSEDKVFGKISSKQIADELKKIGFNIDKKCLYIAHDLDVIGTHEIDVILHKQVKFKIRVNLRK